MATEFKASRLLVVEGKEDVQFFAQFVKYLKLRDVQIHSINGKSDYPKKLRAISSESNFIRNVESLGLVRDANTNPAGTIVSIKGALKSSKIPVPRRPLQLASSRNIKVMFLVLPGERTKGELEDLCLQSVGSYKAMPCVDEYIKCLKKQGLQGPRKVPKAKVQVFLASRSRRNLPTNVGRAAEMGIWNFDAPAFKIVKDFLQNVFS